MRVYSYVVISDSGFAPNPFHDSCTLACCKPKIRQAAEVDDLIIGMSSRSERFVYAMRVSKVIDFKAYWAGASYKAKRPKMSSTRREDRQGDNIYKPTASGGFDQLPSRHRCRFTPEQVARVEQWFEQLPQGRLGRPTPSAKEADDDVACPPCG